MSFCPPNNLASQDAPAQRAFAAPPLKVAIVSEDALFAPTSTTGARFHPGVIRGISSLSENLGFTVLLRKRQNAGPPTDGDPQRELLLEVIRNEGIVMEAIPSLQPHQSALRELLDELKSRGRDTQLTDDSVVISLDDELAPLAAALGLSHYDIRPCKNLVPSNEDGRQDLASNEPPSLKETENAPDWYGLISRLRAGPRTASLHRVTKETDVKVLVCLDGRGHHSIATGIGFFDHMLAQVAYHGLIDLEVKATGDLHIDEHHTVEDVGITLGKAVAQALGDKRGIERFGYVAPLDDALARVTLDFSGRSFLVWKASFQREKIGDLPTEMIPHFFRSFCDEARCNLHVEMYGDNDHHRAESIFKAFGRALHMAFAHTRPLSIPSTKGTL